MDMDKGMACMAYMDTKDEVLVVPVMIASIAFAVLSCFFLVEVDAHLKGKLQQEQDS